MNRILIVDDREDNRYYLQVLLENQGYSVEPASQGTDALALARDRPPDLIISDLLMPVMDGYTLLREWKADEVLTNVPFIVFTATYTDESDERLALDLGATAFIRKPCDNNEFCAAIRKILDNPPITNAKSHPTENRDKRLLKEYNDVLIRKLEQKTEQLELVNRQLREEITARRQIQEELQLKNLVLETQQGASLDAILVVGKDDQILSYNSRFTELWGISRDLVAGGKDSPILRKVTSLVDDPASFLARVQHLYKNKDEKGHDEVHLKDGRIVDRYTSPITDNKGNYLGRVWFFRDITMRKKHEKQLLEQDELLRKMSALARVGGWAFNPKTGEGTWTEEIARIHDLDPSVIPNVSYGLDFYHGESRNVIEKAVRDAVQSGEPYDLTLELVSATGIHKWVRTICNPVIKDGNVVEIRGAMQDVTEQKITEDHVRRLNRILSILSRINALIVKTTNREDLYAESCRIALNEGGMVMALIAVADEDADRIVPVASMGKNADLLNKIRNVLSSKNKNATMVWQAINDKRPVVSHNVAQDPRVLFRKDYIENGVNSIAVLPLVASSRVIGVLALYAEASNFFQQEELNVLVELADDIAYATDHLDKQERVDYLSLYDELTGLAKPSLFLDRIAQHISTAHRTDAKPAVLAIDLERFKSINDSLGRSTGDALLKQFAEWLTRQRIDKNLVARMYSDQFAVIVPDVESRDKLEEELLKLIDAFAGHVFHLQEEAVYRLGFKIGIAMYPEHGSDANSLFRNAEIALRNAKRSGERYLFYAQKMDQKVAIRLNLENQLREAVKNEEFVLHYQPKFDCKSGIVSGAEALIRWDKPGVGLIYPNDFIDILEETGMIDEVGRWVLRKAVADYLGWLSIGLEGVRIAVNVSPTQLRKPDFVELIKQKVAISSRAAEALEVELTESSVIENVKASIVALSAIRDMGVHVTIDDFGTGFSSLSYLSKLPLDALKIDREFITGMMGGPEGLALVSTIINLAHSLKLKVVAEGVEVQDQLDLLRLLGCDEIQGFIYDKAMPADLFANKYLKPGPAG